YTHLGYATDLNLDFIQGTSIIPSILKYDYAYPQGQYSVDVFVNNEKTGTAELNISQEDEKNNMLCFSPKWINSADIMLDTNKYDDVYNI
ncbi:FimD/PapC N-terminal domain-containing protein, partial [Escherichia coli]|uniref:FimD/PapC N-terminal domain-containing protein n=1 Tax=Escherichia coli TaxID=562 RepID=UPI000CDA085B